MTEIALPKLADTRSTQRLLNIIRQLEEHVGNLQAASPASTDGVATPSELTRLREQNRKLRTRQRHAISRLDDLLARMEQPEAGSLADGEAA